MLSIFNEITAVIKPCLRTASQGESVTVIEIPPHTLRRQLVHNRLYDRLYTRWNSIIRPNSREDDCKTSDTVYLISCKACGDEYIGEMGKPL